MTWNTVTSTSGSWSTQAATSQAWNAPDAISAESRLNRVYPQDEASFTPGELDFIWRIASDGYFFVATGNRVQIRSSITEGP